MSAPATRAALEKAIAAAIGHALSKQANEHAAELAKRDGEIAGLKAKIGQLKLGKIAAKGRARGVL